MSLDELLGLHFGFSVSDLDIVGSWLAILLILLQALVPILQGARGGLTEVISNDSIDWCLRSVWPTVGKLLLRQRDLHTTIFEGAHAEWDPVIVALTVNVVLRGRHVSSDN